MAINREKHNRAITSDLVALSYKLTYQPPLDWESLLGFLESRVIRGVEQVVDDVYYRTVSVGGRRGWIKVGLLKEWECPALQVMMAPSLEPVAADVLMGVQRLFDLETDTTEIAKHLGELAMNYPGLRVPGAFDGFETVVRALLGQQVSVKAATTLAGRWAERFGESVKTPFVGLNRLTPTPGVMATAVEAHLISLGILSSRAASIVTIARAVSEGTLQLSPMAQPESTIAQLRKIRGIGDWTAQYIAMRVLAWPDAFPHTDLGIMKALKERRPKQLLTIAEPWRPWRAYATMCLWKSLATE